MINYCKTHIWPKYSHFRMYYCTSKFENLKGIRIVCHAPPLQKAKKQGVTLLRIIHKMQNLVMTCLSGKQRKAITHLPSLNFLFIFVQSGECNLSPLKYEIKKRLELYAAFYFPDYRCVLFSLEGGYIHGLVICLEKLFCFLVKSAVMCRLYACNGSMFCISQE